MILVVVIVASYSLILTSYGCTGSTYSNDVQVCMTPYKLAPTSDMSEVDARQMPGVVQPHLSLSTFANAVGVTLASPFEVSSNEGNNSEVFE